AAVDFAREQHPDEKIGVIGVSLGGAAALLASPLAIDALVLESVYSTIENAVTNRVAARLGFLAKIPAQLLLMQLEPRLGIEPEQLHPIDKIPKVDCPVLIISGLEDQHTTAAETRKMFEAARQPKQLWRIPGAAHVDLFQFAGKQYEHHVLEFFVKHMR
ncbi:MAG: alpha/beta hydrolase, partial [Calditrichaeota bacterium]